MSEIMTREHLTEKYEEELRKELRRALTYFGEWDEERLRSTIDNQVTTLWINLSAIDAETLYIEDDVVEGYPITVGYKCVRFPDIMRKGEKHGYEKMYIVDLMVHKDGFQYVLQIYEQCHKRGTKTETEFGPSVYKNVKLEDLNKEEYTFSIEI